MNADRTAQSGRVQSQPPGRVGRAGREVLRRTAARTGVDLRPPLVRVRNRLTGQVHGATAQALAAEQVELKQLRADVQELRGLGGRVAELVDLVTELLIVAAKRDDPEFQRLVANYLEGV